MKDKPDYRGGGPAGPFDSAATARLLNMGVVKSDGTAHKENMNAFIIIFAGLFFADLNESYDSAEDITAIYKLFLALHSRKNYHHMYLLLSMQYDYFKKPMPDPVWWLAGSPGLIAAYMDGFMKRLRKLMAESGTLGADGKGRDGK